MLEFVMIELFRAIPDVDVLLALRPEELGAKLLFLVRQLERDRSINPANYLSEVSGQGGSAPAYPRDRLADVELACVEAWSWLLAQGLIVPEPGSSGNNGWRQLSRRARTFENEEDFTGVVSAQSLRNPYCIHRLQKRCGSRLSVASMT